MAEFLAHKVSYEKRRDIHINTTPQTIEAPVTPDGKTTFDYGVLAAAYKAKLDLLPPGSALGALVGVDDPQEPSLGAIIRSAKVPSGATIFQPLPDQDKISGGDVIQPTRT